MRRKPWNDLARFWSKVAPPDAHGCRRWLGTMRRDGYGAIGVVVDGKRTPVLAHKWIYQAIHGLVPKGLDVSHTCLNRWCVNPDHLVAETRQENLWRTYGATADAFRCGHPRTSDNTTMSLGHPECRICRNLRTRKSYQRHLEQRRAAARAYWQDPVHGEVRRAKQRASRRGLVPTPHQRELRRLANRTHRKRHASDPVYREAARRASWSSHYRKRPGAARAAWEAYERAQLAMLGVASLPHGGMTGRAESFEAFSRRAAVD
jgi:hypothetical protein